MYRLHYSIYYFTATFVLFFSFSFSCFSSPLTQTLAVINDLERACEDGLACVENLCKKGEFLPGGGAVEMEVASHLRKLADETDSLDQYAIRKVFEE